MKTRKWNKVKQWEWSRMKTRKWNKVKERSVTGTVFNLSFQKLFLSLLIQSVTVGQSKLVFGTCYWTFLLYRNEYTYTSHAAIFWISVAWSCKITAEMYLDRHNASKFQLVFNVHMPGGKRLALKLETTLCATRFLKVSRCYNSANGFGSPWHCFPVQSAPGNCAYLLLFMTYNCLLVKNLHFLAVFTHLSLALSPNIIGL